ncbi:MAG: shikimate kinase [Bryobacteraceae bacterium]
MNAKLKRTPAIVLVGFMGSGKSTVGKRLAAKLGWEFCDIDEEIEREQGMTISAIFEKQGEPAFRAIEAEAIRKRVQALGEGRPTVVALGGGAFVQPGNAEFLLENTVTVWLDIPIEIMRSRVEGHSHRPLACDPKRFEELYHARRPAYARAEYRVAATSSDQAVEAILALPIF